MEIRDDSVASEDDDILFPSSSLSSVDKMPSYKQRGQAYMNKFFDGLSDLHVPASLQRSNSLELDLKRHLQLSNPPPSQPQPTLLSKLLSHIEKRNTNSASIIAEMKAAEAQQMLEYREMVAKHEILQKKLESNPTEEVIMEVAENSAAEKTQYSQWESQKRELESKLQDEKDSVAILQEELHKIKLEAEAPAEALTPSKESNSKSLLSRLIERLSKKKANAEVIKAKIILNTNTQKIEYEKMLVDFGTLQQRFKEATEQNNDELVRQVQQEGEIQSFKQKNQYKQWEIDNLRLSKELQAELDRQKMLEGELQSLTSVKEITQINDLSSPKPFKSPSLISRMLRKLNRNKHRVSGMNDRILQLKHQIENAKQNNLEVSERSERKTVTEKFQTP